MIAPLASSQPKNLKPDPISINKKGSTFEKQPQRSELADAIGKVLDEGKDNPDNRQKLNNIQSLLSNVSGDDLNKLVEALPDNALKQWIKEIRNSATPNSGLSADQRQEFFSLLGKGLSPDQASRWQSVMPESLKDEFSSAVTKHSITDQGSANPDANASEPEQDSLFEMGNSAQARSLQLSIAKDSSDSDSPAGEAAPIAKNAAESAEPDPNGIVEIINTIAPDATAEVKQQLIDAYTNVKTVMGMVGQPGTDPETLAHAIQDTNNVFREHGLGNLLPATRKGHIIFTYNSDNLPSELSTYRSRKTSNDREFGDRDWSVRVSLFSMPESMLVKIAAQQLARPMGMAAAVRSAQFDTERGFAAPENIDGAATDLEQTLFSGGAPDPQTVLSKMQSLDAQVLAGGGAALTKTESGQTYISAELLRFADSAPKTDTTSNSASPSQEWISTAQLSPEQLLAAADQLRIDALSSQLNDTGTTDLDTATRAINALNPNGTELENQKHVNQYLKLQRSIQVASRDPDLESNLLNNLQETDRQFREAGLPTVLPGPNRRGGYIFRFTSDTLPSELSHYKSRKTGNDREFGDRDWYARVPMSELPDRMLINYAKRQLATMPANAATSNLSQMDQFEGFPVTHTADIQEMIDSAKPIDAGTNTDGEPTLGDLLQKFDLESAAPDSKYDYRALADTSYQVASSLLTDSGTSMSQEEMKTLISWVDAESFDDIGFYNREEYRESNDESAIRDLGPYGNFGQAKFRFAQAWLGSTKEQRLEYMGLDKGRWSQAQPYISAAINSDQQARNIERSEFGFDDVVKLVIGGVATYVTGGLASGAVAGMFAAGGALAGTVSASTATYLAAAAGAAAGSFSSTFIMTGGDVDEALKSGLMGAITGGLGKYASSLQGAARPVAQAIINGVQAELTGKDFQDGVLASVAQNFGADVSARLQDHMPEFIAGFAGKATEVAIRTGGDKELMQQELEQYVIDFASGQATAKLTAVMGEDYEYVANSLGDLANVVIRSGGDMGKVRDYLNSDQFYASLASNLGNQVTESFGGKEKFSAVLYGKITNIMIASRGDTDKITNNIEGLALSVVGEWAGQKLTDQLGGVLGETKGGLAEALGSLTNVAITSGWDATAINTFMHGPLVAALGTEAAGVIPERFGSAGEFLGRALERLTQSYSVNQGDMRAVAEDMANFIVDEAINFDEQVQANKPLSAGDTGPYVEKAQKQLQDLGYLDAVTGTFDAATSDALSRFQEDQITHLTNTLGTETNITLRRMINDQITAISTERDAGKIDVSTRVLLENPYTDSSGPIKGDDKPDDLNNDWQTASMVDLGIGSQGPGVTRLQHLLTDNGYEPGTIDGIFGEDTARALEQFQQEQVDLMLNKLFDTDRATEPVLYDAIGKLSGGLEGEKLDGKTGEYTSKLLQKPATNETLTNAGISDILDANELTSNWENAPLTDLNIGDAGPGVTRLQHELTNLGYNAGVIDGIFGNDTAAALSLFQQDQLKVLNDELAKIDSVAQPEFHDGFSRIINDLASENTNKGTGELTAALLQTPLKPEMFENTQSVDNMAAMIAATVNGTSQEGPQEGLMQVGLFSSIFGNGTSLGDIAGMLSKQSPENIAKTIDKVDLDDIGKWADQMSDMSVEERAELFEVLTKNLDGDRLARFYDGMSDTVRTEYIDSINKLGDNSLKEKFVEVTQRNALEKADVPPGLSPDEKKLYLDLLQLGLDIVGIAEPTPFADGANTVISVARGDWLGAGLSLLGVIPYIGDVAKLGKLGKWAQTVEDTISMTAKNSALAEKINPLLTKISDSIDAIPASVWNKLPESAQQTLSSVKQKIDDVVSKADDAIKIVTGRGVDENWLIGHNTKIDTGTGPGRSISGSHNMESFNAASKATGILELSRIEVAPGIYQVEYRVPKRNSANEIIPGEYKSGKPHKKTIYDDNVHSDADIAAKSAEAGRNLTFEEGNRNSNPITIDGLQFIGYRDLDTGEITNVHLRWPDADDLQ